jgi:hypothetical protein
LGYELVKECRKVIGAEGWKSQYLKL